MYGYHAGHRIAYRRTNSRKTEVQSMLNIKKT